MEFIKKHKMLVMFLIVLIIFIVFILLFLKQFMYDNSKSEYGNRLDGIEKVEISSKKVDQLKSDISSDEKVKSVKYDLKGRLINVIIEVSTDANIDEAKNFGNKVLEYFDEDEKSYYDIQVFLKNENEKAENFPLIGYKHKTSESISWD